MGIIENIGAKQREERKKANPSPEREGPTLKDILNDPEKFHLFGIYLEQQGDEALAAEIAQGTSMDTTLVNDLNQRRIEFLEIYDRAALISKSLDQRALASIAETSPDLKKIANIVGAEGIQDVLRRQITESAIRERYDAANIEAKIRELADAQQEIGENEKLIEAFTRKHGISEAVYQKALESGDDTEIRRIILQKIADDPRYKQYTPKGWFGMLGKTESTNQGLLTTDLESEMASATTMDQINDLLNKREAAMQSIGNVLYLALMRHDIFKESLMKNARNEKPDNLEKDLALGEFRKAMEPKEEDVKKAYAKFKADNKADYTARGLDEADLRTDFSRGYATSIAAKGKKGFWANLIGKLLAPNIIEDMLK